MSFMSLKHPESDKNSNDSQGSVSSEQQSEGKEEFSQENLSSINKDIVSNIARNSQ